MRPRTSGYTIFPPKDGQKLPNERDYRLLCPFLPNHYSVYSVNSAIRSKIDRILFCSFRNQNRSQKNSITANSVYSHSGIAPKERALKHIDKTKFNAGFKSLQARYKYDDDYMYKVYSLKRDIHCNIT